MGLVWLLVVTAGDPAVINSQQVTERILDDAKDLTREQEGMVGHTYQPTPDSGITICYGYDMGRKSRTRVEADLGTVVPPVPDIWIERLAGGAGRTSGTAAFIEVTSDIELDEVQCASLFEVTYATEAAAARDFATNPTEYGPLGVAYEPADWERLHPAIQGIVIDLKFRGDYRPWWSEQQTLQQAIVDNDPVALLGELERGEIFPNDLITVATFRYQARIDWLAGVVGGS